MQGGAVEMQCRCSVDAVEVQRGCKGVQGGAGGCQTITDQGRPWQTMADHGRPSHFDIRGATNISDAFFVPKIKLHIKSDLQTCLPFFL